MELPVGDYYAIVDANGTQKNYTVIAEYDNRPEAEARAGQLSFRDCTVYGERGVPLYRIICEGTLATSKPSVH